MARWLRTGFGILLAMLAQNAMSLGGDFTLTADDGSDYTLSDSRGKVVVLSFGYTHCPDVCPTGLAVIANALNSIGDDAKRVDAFFVSLDPERDTPDFLRQYTRFFHPGLRGLTGSADQLQQVADDYHVRYEFVGKGTATRYTMDHSANIYVVDVQGRLLRIIPHGLPPQVLADSLTMALTMADRKNRQLGLHSPPHEVGRSN
jgi:protein SCO1/2